jgi:hypothetical protein
MMSDWCYSEIGMMIMPASEDNRMYDAMFADPELHDENDPAYKLELFETMKAMGHGPDKVWNDPEFAEEYRQWLKNNP